MGVMSPPWMAAGGQDVDLALAGPVHEVAEGQRPDARGVAPLAGKARGDRHPALGGLTMKRVLALLPKDSNEKCFDRNVADC